MPNRIYKFTDINEAQFFLNGGIIGAPIAKGIGGLTGLTLTFTAPAFAVTFGAISPAPTGRDAYKLLLGDLKAQVEAANPGILVSQLGGRIVFVEKVPSVGVALSANNEVAKTLLGFDQHNATTGKLFRPMGIAGGPPNYTLASVNESTHIIYTWE